MGGPPLPRNPGRSGTPLFDQCSTKPTMVPAIFSYHTLYSSRPGPGDSDFSHSALQNRCTPHLGEEGDVRRFERELRGGGDRSPAERALIARRYHNASVWRFEDGERRLEAPPGGLETTAAR